jgi:pimeloyl-ACP methyl ester carboxylesterase
MGVVQRPALACRKTWIRGAGHAAALNEPVGEPAWKTIPSWFLYGSLDKNIPPRVHAFTAKRAGAQEVVEIQGASHVVMVSHPQALANLIERAAEQGQP